jgi:N-methylhydantoinase A/oxoprolinase/acetone carboxylase beta subunit
MEIEGPAVVEEKTSTTVLYPGQRAVVDAYLNIEVDVAGEPQRRGRGSR